MVQPCSNDYEVEPHEKYERTRILKDFSPRLDFFETIQFEVKYPSVFLKCCSSSCSLSST